MDLQQEVHETAITRDYSTRCSQYYFATLQLAWDVVPRTRHTEKVKLIFAMAW